MEYGLFVANHSKAFPLAVMPGWIEERHYFFFPGLDLGMGYMKKPSAALPSSSRWRSRRLEANSERDWQQGRAHVVVRSVMVSGLHVDFPATVAYSDRESQTDIYAAGGPPIVSLGQAGSEGGYGAVFVDPNVAIIPAAPCDRVDSKNRPIKAFKLEAVVCSHAVQIDTPDGRIDRMNHGPVGR